MNLSFTIIVPVFNVESYIEKCVDSVLKQTYSNFELILIDDGSTDNSLAVLQHYTDTRIQVIKQSNVGVSATRNRGISIARGDFIYFLDSDDWIEPTLLQEAADAISVNAADVLLFNFFTDQTSADGALISSDKSTLLPIERLLSEVVDESIFTFTGYIWNKLYRRTFLIAHKITFDTKTHLFEDVIFNTNVFSKTKKIIQLTGHYYHYMSRPNASLVKSYNSNILKYIAAMNQAIADFLKTTQTDQKTQKQLLAQNVMMGARHNINTLFKYSNESNSAKFKILSSILKFPVLKNQIKFYQPKSTTDKIFKFLIANNLTLGLFAVCKMKK